MNQKFDMMLVLYSAIFSTNEQLENDTRTTEQWVKNLPKDEKKLRDFFTYLDWAVDNPQYDFSSAHEFEHNLNNKTLYNFLCRMQRSIEPLRPLEKT